MGGEPAPYQVAAAQQAFLARVYQWMAVGLLVTAIVAYLTATTPALLSFVFGNRLVFWGLVIAELALVWSISARATSMDPGTATGLFLLYSALNGLTLAAVFLVFTGASLASTFVVTAGTFAATSIYGYVTKRDLTSLGSFLFMGLIGLILASVVNLFLRNETVYWVTSYIGVFIFVGLTAYDTQRLKAMGARAAAHGERVGALAIVGALALYLDFVNLFLYLLRIFGNRRS
jgi:FtsH-binding integral membrane protein